MSFFRRAGALIARFFQSAADPAAEPGKILLYAKDVAGITQLFARLSDGTVTQLTTRPQMFRYVAVGGEANPMTIGAAQGFVARASANYNVQVTTGGPLANPIKVPRALVASFAINQFDVELSAPLDAGDVLQFTVEDLP